MNKLITGIEENFMSLHRDNEIISINKQVSVGRLDTTCRENQLEKNADRLWLLLMRKSPKDQYQVLFQRRLPSLNQLTIESSISLHVVLSMIGQFSNRNEISTFQRVISIGNHLPASFRVCRDRQYRLAMVCRQEFHFERILEFDRLNVLEHLQAFVCILLQKLTILWLE